MRTSTRSLAMVALFAALTAVSAQLSFALPFTAVPFTLQVLAVLLAGALLGPGWGALAMGVYLLLGAVGLPVFAQGQAGLGVLVGPTGGYLWSYPLAAAVVGGLTRGGLLRTALAMLAGLAVIYAGGAGWAILVIGKAAGVVLTGWVLPFIPYDLAKVFLAAAVADRVRAALPVRRAA